MGDVEYSKTPGLKGWKQYYLPVTDFRLRGRQ